MKLAALKKTTARYAPSQKQKNILNFQKQLKGVRVQFTPERKGTVPAAVSSEYSHEIGTIDYNNIRIFIIIILEYRKLYVSLQR